MKTLGILGGMGPEATLDLFRKIVELTPAKRDQDHLHIVIDNYAQIPDRTANILAGGEDPLPYLVEGAKRLESAGVDAIIMPCNTAHYFLPRIKLQVDMPFISIIDSAVAEVATIAPHAKSVLPISTTGTKSTRLYEDALLAAGYTVPETPKDIQDEIMYCIYEGVKKGETLQVVNRFQRAIEYIDSEIKPDVLISACTEIPILMPHITTNTPTVDATLALARAGILFCS
ncbi:MAG: amino acid racemase [Deferribacteraceae bacterium]|jgi:aspartate racemase|nr:amino acid racemase [Deferribacteraceae bacterium]